MKYGTSLQPGAFTYGLGGLGILAELVPSEGSDGAAYFYGSLDMPGDTGAEISARITRYPVNGTFTLDGDTGAYSYSGTTDYLLYELRVWDVLDTTDVGYGLGVGRLDFQVGDVSGITGNLLFSDLVAEGALSGGTPSSLTGDVVLEAVVPAGLLSVDVSGIFSGDVALEAVAPAGSLTSAGSSGAGATTVEIWAHPMSNGYTAEENVVAIRTLLAAQSVGPTVNEITVSMLAALNGTTIPVDVRLVDGAAPVIPPATSAIAAAVWAKIIEGSMSAEQMLRVLMAINGGNGIELNGPNPKFYGLDGVKVRVVGEVDGTTRTITTRDGT